MFLMLVGGEAVTRHNRIRWLILIMAGLLILSGCSEEPEETTGSTDNFGGLVCLEYSRFSGSFPEDGSGREVTDVAAMLVYNSSSEFLDYATVECSIGSSTGTFQITGLPPGATAWVLEQDARTVSDGDTFTARTCEQYAYRSDAVMSTELLSVEPDGSTLTVKNVSDKTLENVCVYYKSLHSDGHYFGGICYMLNFGTLDPGESAQKQSSHFGSDSKIVRYSFQES